jgi:hypothetical protein
MPRIGGCGAPSKALRQFKGHRRALSFRSNDRRRASLARVWSVILFGMHRHPQVWAGAAIAMIRNFR